MFEWLPYEEGILDTVPAEEAEKIVWLHRWYSKHVTPRAEHFRRELIARYGEQRGRKIEYVEAYEISEYATSIDQTALKRLFPDGR